MIIDDVSTITLSRIVMSMSTNTLVEKIQKHIETHYGGNQAAFARAVGMKPQSLNTLLKGKVALPQADIRRRLSRELGIPHVQFFVMAGELDESELEEAGVQGVVSDRPVDYVHRAVDAYEWDLKTAAVVIDMIDVWMKAWTGETPTITRIPLTFIPRPEDDDES